MKGFILKILIFTVLLLLTISISLFFAPDPVSSENLLGALPYKHKLLEEAKSPKIILVGGSNVSFGFDSKKISDAFNRPVVNMGIHASIGLHYIANDVKPFIKKGDLVVLTPEYSQFVDSFEGNIETVSILFDVYPEGREFVGLKQWMHLLNYIPTYAASKVKNNIAGMFHLQQQDFGVYTKKSFNAYGDAYLHWNLPPELIAPAKKNSGKEEVNNDVILFLKDYKSFIDSKGATLVILPPAYQQTSFDNQRFIIDKIGKELKDNGLPFIASTERYRFADSLCFNSASHLTKEGLELRTDRVIQDIGSYVRGNTLDQPEMK